MAKKVYVKVNADFSPEGKLRPRMITWIDGQSYVITRIIENIRAASLKVGGCGIRYTIVVEGKERYLFREDDRWFVEAKEP